MSSLEHILLSRLRLRHVRQLSAVWRYGSISRAAEALHISQPALSKGIHEIETMVRLPLFERTPRGLVPTPAGARFLRHCRAVESELRKAGQDIEAHVAGTGGQVTVGAQMVALPTLLPQAVSRLMKEADMVTVRVVDGSAKQLLAALYAGDVDLIVGRLSDISDGDALEHEVLHHEPICVIAGGGHPLAKRRHVEYRDLCDYPWVLPPPDSPAYIPITELFLHEGLPRPRICVESTSFMMIRSLIQDQPVLAAMPRQVIERDVMLKQVRILPVKLPYAPLPVGITRHATREPSAATLRFMQCLRVETPSQQNTKSHKG